MIDENPCPGRFWGEIEEAAEFKKTVKEMKAQMSNADYSRVESWRSCQWFYLQSPLIKPRSVSRIRLFQSSSSFIFF
jgi:hypothetical protein